MHSFQCPHCAGMFQVLPNVSGQAVACPHCNAGVLIPEMSAPGTLALFSQSEAPPISTPTPGSPEWMQPRTPAPPSQTEPSPSISEPPLVSTPTPLPGASALPLTNAAPIEPSPVREFVIPTLDGGQTVIQDTGKMAVSGAKRRRLRNLTSEEKSTRRWIKNVIVAGSCGIVLVVLLWWLLR